MTPAQTESAPQPDSADGPATSQRAPVVIIGAGPTGLSAAALLADFGVPSVVLERWEDVYPQPRAVHLDDEVYRILARLGLAEAFEHISRPARGLRLVTDSLDLIAEFPRGEDIGVHGFPAASMFDQPELERLLRDAVAARDLVTVRGGVEVVDISQRDSSVIVHAADRSTGERLTVEGAYLLGCDGAGSLTRSVVGAHWRDFGFSQRWLVIDVETTADLRQWEGVQQVCDTRRAATYMRIGDDRYRWEFQLLDGESASDYADLAAVLPLMRPWLPRAADLDLRLVRCAEYTFNARVADRWRHRRIFLLGDAAHLTPPFIGQGMGAGIRDAANLSWKLAAVLAGGVPESSLDSYESERKPHTTGLIRLAMLTGALMTGGGRGGDALRGVIAPLLARLPAFVSRLADSATPALGPSYYVRAGVAGTPVRALRGLVSADYTTAGSLAPNSVLSSSGLRLDDRAPGFALVSLDEPSPEQRFEIGRRGATVIVVDSRSGLGIWLSDHDARAALVRPDGTVMAAGRAIASIYTLIPPMPVTAEYSWSRLPHRVRRPENSYAGRERRR